MGSVLQKSIGFLLFPIYTRLLTPAAYGSQDLIFTSVTITSYLLILGLDSGTARNYYDAKTPAEKKKIISTYLWFELIISVPATLILIGLATPICTLLFRDATLTPYFRVGVASLPFSLVASVSLLTLRLTFQSRTFSIVTASSVLVQAIASIVLVVVLRLDVMGVFLAHLVTMVFRSLVGIALTYNQFGWILSSAWLKLLLVFGMPLVPASLSIWIMNYSNRYFLVRLTSLDEVGLLSVGTKVASIAVLVITAFRMAWGPFAYSLIDDENLARKTYSRVLTYYLIVTLIAAVSLSIFSRELVLLLSTPVYEESASTIPFLALSATFWGAAVIVGIGYGIAKRSYHTTIATIGGAIVNIGLNFILIPRWGIVGAAISTMAGNLIAMMYSYFVAQRYFKVKYNFRRIAPLLSVALIAITAGMLIDYLFPVWSIQLFLYKVVLFLFSFTAFLATKAIRYGEISRAFSLTFGMLLKQKHTS